MTQPPYDRAKLIADLVRDEAERLHVYRCSAGHLTIGVGRNLDARRGDGSIGITAAETKTLGITRASCIANGITREQSRALLADDIAGCETDLDRKLSWWRTLDPVRQRALLNMCFNMGVGTLLTFTGTLAALRAGQFAAAADRLSLSAWDRQVGARADRIQALIRTGRDPA